MMSKTGLYSRGDGQDVGIQSSASLQVPIGGIGEEVKSKKFIEHFDM
jgi:hypothetical protein